MIVWRKGDRVISIDEYIEYLEKCADITKGSDEGDRLSRQHTQLAVWLKELKSLRWLFKDIQDTCEYLYLENIRYRSCLTDDAENTRQILGEMSELKAENAKLRELVRDLVRLPAVPCFDCFGCRYERHHDCECGFKCVLVERAKRLGIEVDE